jgi:hypothetical protein
MARKCFIDYSPVQRHGVYYDGQIEAFADIEFNTPVILVFITNRANNKRTISVKPPPRCDAELIEAFDIELPVLGRTDSGIYMFHTMLGHDNTIGEVEIEKHALHYSGPR